MTETEKLLTEAQDLALRAFDEPGQETVMEIFRELCAERDRLSWESSQAAGVTVH